MLPRGTGKHNPISISPPLFLDDEEEGQRVIVGAFSPAHAPLCLDLSPDEYTAFIETVVRSNDIWVIVHDLKSFLKPYYEKFGGQGFTGVSLSRFSCTYILSYLLDPPERIEGEIVDSIETSLLLENLALKHLGEAYPRLEAWLWDKDPDEAIYLRLWEDARYIYRVWEALENKLKGSPPDGPDLLKLYEDVERPLILALLDMECRGIRVNHARAAIKLPHLEKVLEILKEKIPAKAKPIFENGNAEANEEELKSAGDKYVNKYRRIGIRANLLRSISGSQDRCAHSNYSQCSTATGRIVAKNPPLQSISRVSRKLYLLPDDGHVLMEADYSQAEARILAALSGDPVLCAIFAENMDEHARSSALGKLFPLWKQHGDFHSIFAAVLSRETGRTISRDQSKAVMYGISYGMSQQTLADELGIPEQEASKIIEVFFEMFPKVRLWKEEVIKELRKYERKHGIAGRYLRTPMGRRRSFDRSFAKDPGEARRAVNFLLQGHVADLIKQAQVGLYHEMTKRNMKSRIVLQLHDALYFSVQTEELEEMKDLVKQVMEQPLNVQGLGCSIIMRVDQKVSVGPAS